jgi:superfamily I DNA/RNA helicase
VSTVVATCNPATPSFVMEVNRLSCGQKADVGKSYSVYPSATSVSRLTAIIWPQGEPGLADEKDNFDALLKAAEKGGASQDYTVEIFGNQGRNPELINLMTLHGSKGLEFEAVIMVSFR